MIELLLLLLMDFSAVVSGFGRTLEGPPNQPPLKLRRSAEALAKAEGGHYASVKQPLAAQVMSRPLDIAFRVQIMNPGFSESVAVADFNKDGRLDILSAEYAYEAPNWTKHKVRDIAFNGSYIDNFSDLPVDVDGDGYTDVVADTRILRAESSG